MALLGQQEIPSQGLTDAFGILGLMVIGAMEQGSALCNVRCIFCGTDPVVIQDVLNGVVMNILPFGIIIGAWMRFEKGRYPRSLWFCFDAAVWGLWGWLSGNPGTGRVESTEGSFAIPARGDLQAYTRAPEREGFIQQITEP